MKIKKSNIKYIILLIFIFHLGFIKFPHTPNYRYINYILVLITFLYLLLKLKFIIRRLNKKIVGFLLMYMVLVFISAYTNRNNHVLVNSYYSAVFYILTVFDIFLGISYVAIKKNFSFIIRVFLVLSVTYLFLNDVLLLLYPNLFTKNKTYYLVGNKFSVSYLHLQVLVLFLMNRSNKNRSIILLYDRFIFLILILISIYVTIVIESRVGLISIILFILILKFPINFLENPRVFLITLISSSLLSFGFNFLLNNKFIHYFIVNILHKDLTLTGRISIYDKIPILLKDHIILGYGYGSSYETWLNYMGMPNSQNATIDIILEQGLIATILLIGIFYCIFQLLYNSKEKSNHLHPVITIIYIFVLLGSVEITFGVPFICWGGLLYAAQAEIEKSNQTRKDVLNESFNIINAKS